MVGGNCVLFPSWAAGPGLSGTSERRKVRGTQAFGSEVNVSDDEHDLSLVMGRSSSVFLTEQRQQLQ